MPLWTTAPPRTSAAARTTRFRTPAAASASSTTSSPPSASLRREGRLRRVLVVDLDVHQGDGTHAALAGDDEAFTLSLNGRRQLPVPARRGRPRRDLPDGTGDDAYLDALAALLPRAVARARAELCFYLAGADPFEGIASAGWRSRSMASRAATSSCARRCCAPAFRCA